MKIPLLSSTVRAAGILAFFGLVSRGFGLVRDRLLAIKFGASETLDIYYSAFRIPDLVFNIIVVGALASAFIPVFVEYHKKSKAEGWRLASNFLNISIVVVLAVSALLFVLMPWLMPLIAPGFDAAARSQAATLARLMLLSPILFSISAIIGSVLQSLQRFTAYAIAPVLYNLGIIAGVLFLTPRFGVYGLGLGVVLGALAHLIVQMIAVARAGFVWHGIIDFRNKGLREISRLMVPRTIALAGTQFSMLVMNALASTLVIGSIAILNLANNLWIVPVSIIGIALPTAVFPVLSDLSLAVDHRPFLKMLTQSMGQIIFLGIPATFAMIIFRESIIALVLGAGQFGLEDVSTTAAVVGLFSLAIVPYSLTQLLNRAFYAMHNTVTPVVIAVVAIACHIGLSFVFVRLPFASLTPLLGLVLAFTLATVINFLGVIFCLNRLMPGGFEMRVVVTAFKTSAAASLSYVLLLVTQRFLPHLTFAIPFWTILTNFLIALIIYGICFIVLAALLKVRELVLLFERGT